MNNELSERIAREVVETFPQVANELSEQDAVKIIARIASHHQRLLQPAQPRAVWNEAIAAVQSVYMRREPLSSLDREHYATWQTAVTDCEKALEAARDATAWQGIEATIWCEQCQRQVPLSLPIVASKHEIADVTCPRCSVIIVTLALPAKGRYTLASLPAPVEPPQEGGNGAK